jgi:hypothetical protein
MTGARSRYHERRDVSVNVSTFMVQLIAWCLEFPPPSTLTLAMVYALFSIVWSPHWLLRVHLAVLPGQLKMCLLTFDAHSPVCAAESPPLQN